MLFWFVRRNDKVHRTTVPAVFHRHRHKHRSIYSRTVAMAFIPTRATRTAYNLGSVINPGVQRFAAFRTPEGSAYFACLGAGPQRNKNCLIRDFFSKGKGKTQKAFVHLTVGRASYGI